MPSSEKTRNITIHVDLIDRIDTHHIDYQIKNKDAIRFSTYVNKLIEQALDREEFLARTAPNMTFVGVIEDVMHIRDEKKNRTFQVKKQGRRVKCLEDDDSCCDHAIYAMCSPEVTKLFKDMEDEVGKKIMQGRGKEVRINRVMKLASFVFAAALMTIGLKGLFLGQLALKPLLG